MIDRDHNESDAGHAWPLTATHSATKRIAVLSLLAAFPLLSLLWAPTSVSAAPPSTAPSFINPGCRGTDHSTLGLLTQVEPGRLETSWRYEYSLSEGGPWTPVPGGAGTITQAEVEASIEADLISEPEEAQLTGLSPEVEYHVLIVATNSDGTTSEELSSPQHTSACETVPLRPSVGGFSVTNPTATTVRLRSDRLDPDGAETNWRYEYAPAEADGQAPSQGAPAWQPVPGAGGTIAQAEAEAIPLNSGGPFPTLEAKLTGLAPSTAYFVRLFAESEPEWPEASGERSSKTAISAAEGFTSEGSPQAFTYATHAIHGESLRALGAIRTNGSATSEEQVVTIAGSPSGGTFALGFAGQTTGADGSADLTKGSPEVTFSLPKVEGTGDVRLLQTLENGESVYEVTHVVTSTGSFRGSHPITINGVQGKISGEPREVAKEGLTFEVHSKGELVSGKGAKLVSNGSLPPFIGGEVVSGSGIPTGATIVKTEYAEDFTGRLTLSAAATATASGVSISAALPFDATADQVEQALDALSSVPAEARINVYGPPGGPYTAYFGNGAFTGSDQPQISCDAAALTPASTCTVATAQNGGEGYDTHYRVEYVDQRAFETEGGFASPQTQSTPEADLGFGPPGDGLTFLGADLTGLQPATVYHYRFRAANTSPGDPVVYGAEQTLTTPAPEVTSTTCANESLRTGPSAALPDCRAYEQLTPPEKGGAQDIFKYASTAEYSVPGEDGDSLMLRAPGVQWGTSPDPAASTYIFRRGAAAWQMTSATPVAGGEDSFRPEIFNPDLSQTGLQAGWYTTSVSSSPHLEFEVGTPGGPYVTAASALRSRVPTPGGWAAASPDFSKLVLAVEDRTLTGHATGTATGTDLYEYAEGQLRQLNVSGPSPGATIGSCGATLVRGGAEGGGELASPHAVSADGSRVFFEAVPSANCSEPTHLYMRLQTATGQLETRDIGPYSFLAANAAGTELLLQATSGTSSEIFLYDTEAASLRGLFSIRKGEDSVWASEDLSSIYISSVERLTADAPPLPADASEGPRNVYRYDLAAGSLSFLFQGDDVAGSPVGERYLQFTARSVGGLPGGSAKGPEAEQAYRYDSATELVQCLSCASPFDPEPALLAFYKEKGTPTVDGVPRLQFSSANGDYAFFDTPAALVPRDTDGEVQPEGPSNEGNGEHRSASYSTSSDVYEWRRDGLDGCTHLQGCISLLTTGKGGYKNVLLGSADEGRDVFIATHESLLSQDQDNAGDIYDVRSNGGFPPPPPRPVQCEGDACHNLTTPPAEPTLSSSVPSGPGNEPSVKPKHRKSRHHVKMHKKHGQAAHAKRGAHR